MFCLKEVFMLNMVKYSFEDVEFENKWEKDELSRTNVHVIED